MISERKYHVPVFRSGTPGNYHYHNDTCSVFCLLPVGEDHSGSIPFVISYDDHACHNIHLHTCCRDPCPYTWYAIGYHACPMCCHYNSDIPFDKNVLLDQERSDTGFAVQKASYCLHRILLKKLSFSLCYNFIPMANNYYAMMKNNTGKIDSVLST